MAGALVTRGDRDTDTRGGPTPWGPRGKRAALHRTPREAPGVNSRPGDLSLPAPRTAGSTFSRGVSPSPRCLVTAARADSRGTDQAQPQQPLAGAVVSAAARAETRGPPGFLRPLYSSRIDRSSTSWQTLDRAVGTRRRSDSCTRSLCLSAVGAIHTGRVCQRREWSDRFCLGNEGEATNERPVREDDSLALDLGRITQSLFLCLLNEIVEQILES